MATIRSRSRWTTFFLALLSAALGADAAQAQYGGILSGSGATNRSMAGTSTAAPLSAAGALYWNPATISGLSRSELEAGAELLSVQTQMASRFNASSLGPGIPAVGLAGQTSSDTGVAALPTIGLAYLPEGSPVSFGLGVFALAGFGVNYAGSSTNPLLTAPPPTGVGVGPIFSNFQVLQIHPAVAYKLTDRLSIGAGPTVNLAALESNPFITAAPNNANGDAFFTYPPGVHEETTWGAGFDFGVYYQADTWALGASFKSPQWFDKFRLNSVDELGRSRKLTYGLDLPMIISVGAAYTGMERWVFAADVAGSTTPAPTDSGTAESLRMVLRGPGWNSIFAASLGTQCRLTDAISLRAGYSWSQNPAPDSQSFINTVDPAIIERVVTAGASWRVTQNFTLSAAYVHGSENSINGPLLSPAGPVSGTSVRQFSVVRQRRDWSHGGLLREPFWHRLVRFVTAPFSHDSPRRGSGFRSVRES